MRLSTSLSRLSLRHSCSILTPCSFARLLPSELFRRHISQSVHQKRVAVVGAGPAGFYAVQQLAKRQHTQVDIFDRLPAPFGLVRYGVAPDHADVKNVTSTFERIAKLPNVRLLCDVSVGEDAGCGVTVSQLLGAYDAVVLCYGAASSGRRLPVTGKERLHNIVSARQFVAWYNGEPISADSAKATSDHTVTRSVPPIDLSNVHSAVIVGVGNVALDVLRMLTTSADLLNSTDITESALQQLRSTPLRRVTLLARRGPLHVAFTTREFREQLAVSGWRADWSHFDHLSLDLDGLSRQRRRLTETMIKAAAAAAEKSDSEKTVSDSEYSDRRWELRFWRRPIEYLGEDIDDRVGIHQHVRASSKDSTEHDSGRECDVAGVRVAINNPTISVDEYSEETLPCQLVVESVGYSGNNIEPSLLPFDLERGIVCTEGNGRVCGVDRLYACGWIATGPVGVIATTMANAFTVARQVLADLDAISPGNCSLKSTPDDILNMLNQSGVKPVMFSDWLRLDQEEIARGKRVGKTREKVVCVEEMRSIIWSNSNAP